LITVWNTRFGRGKILAER